MFVDVLVQVEVMYDAVGSWVEADSTSQLPGFVIR